MRQPKCTKSYFNFHFFSGGDTPDPRHWGLCLQTPGEGREGTGGKGREGRKGQGEGRVGEGKGKEGEGKGRG